jgi:hypothetical protein
MLDIIKYLITTMFDFLVKYKIGLVLFYMFLFLCVLFILNKYVYPKWVYPNINKKVKQ